MERSDAWLLENKRPAWRYDRRGFIVQALLRMRRVTLRARRISPARAYLAP